MVASLHAETFIITTSNDHFLENAFSRLFFFHFHIVFSFFFCYSLFIVFYRYYRHSMRGMFSHLFSCWPTTSRRSSFSFNGADGLLLPLLLTIVRSRLLFKTVSRAQCYEFSGWSSACTLSICCHALTMRRKPQFESQILSSQTHMFLTMYFLSNIFLSLFCCCCLFWMQNVCAFIDVSLILFGFVFLFLVVLRFFRVISLFLNVR